MRSLEPFHSYGSVIPTPTLAERVAAYVHYFTLYGALRPFGSAIILVRYGAGAGRAVNSLEH